MSFLDSFRSAPPRRQIALTAIAAAAICAVLFAAYFFLLRQPYEVLFTNLRPMDAATIVAELDKKKVPYRLEDGGATILTPANLVESTRLSVMSSDLPLKGMVGFELFNKSDMGLTEFAQKINYQRALQGELARTIMTMEGIDTARVHLSITEPTIFRDDRTPPKASVTILTRPGKALSVGAVRGIQRLVAAAVPELETGAVVVLDDRGEVLSGAAVADAPSTPAMQEREAVEEYYAARVRMALQRAYPDRTMEVSVAAPFMAQGADTLDALNTAARAFALRVSVTAQEPMTTAEEEDAVRIAGEAIGLNPALGDVISVDDRPQQAAQAPAPTSPQPSPWKADEDAKGDAGKLSAMNWSLALALPLLLVLFWLAFVLQRRGAPLRTLTADERAEYTQRLKVLLDGRDDVAPSA